MEAVAVYFGVSRYSDIANAPPPQKRTAVITKKKRLLKMSIKSSTLSSLCFTLITSIYKLWFYYSIRFPKINIKIKNRRSKSNGRIYGLFSSGPG